MHGEKLVQLIIYDFQTFQLNSLLFAMIRSPNPTKWDDPLQYILSKTGYGSSHEMDVGNTKMDVSDSKIFVEYPEVGSSTLRDFIAKI